MEALETSARRRGLTDLLLDVGDHQPEALAFYRALGWSETWREAGPEWQWQTVWFHRSLERSHLTVEVRPCAAAADADAAERGLPTRGKHVHHSRWEQQQAGTATYLLAWEGADVVGHVLLQGRSKYAEVRDRLGADPEVRSLRVAEHARRHGVGTALMGAVAGIAQEQGAKLIGLALEPTTTPRSRCAVAWGGCAGPASTRSTSGRGSTPPASSTRSRTRAATGPWPSTDRVRVPEVLVPLARWLRWCENFERGHGSTVFDVLGGSLTGRAADGSTFTARAPFGVAYTGPAEPAALAETSGPPDDWGVLLVRKGGFAIARLSGPALGESKTGQRHVQGRTKAGGQSQQRFARRRDNQARQAYEAAADHAARILGTLDGVAITGGDRSAVEEVLADRRLVGVRVVGPWLSVPDPRRGVLEQAILDAQALQVDVHNASER